MKKKILILTSTFPRWENDTDPPFVYELSRRLTQTYDVYVLAPHARGALDAELFHGIHVKRFRYAPKSLEKLAYDGGITTNIRKNPFKLLLVAPFLLSQLLSAYGIVRKNNICLLHAHWIIPQGFVAVVLKTLLQRPIKLLCTAHGADVYAHQSKSMIQIKRWILNKCDRITTVSSSMHESIKSLGVNTKIDTLPMGTDLRNEFVPSPDRRNLEQFVFVGRLVEKKGVVYLLRAFSKFADSHPNHRLLIVGEGPEKKHLENMSAELGISKAVCFLGGIQHNKLPQIYQSSALAIFPFIITEEGDQEGFGLVLVEALGCECAVITTDQPTTRDVVRNGITGVSVKQKDVSAVFMAMTKLSNNSEIRERMAKQGRDHVVENFDWQNIAQRYALLINELIH